jgi:RNA polymerase sigma factor (sigma-70 family)
MISEPDFNKLYLNPSFKRKVLGRIASILKKVPYLLDKEDLFQDVFLKIWQNRDKYDPQQAPLEVWAYTVAENTIANTVKSEARRVSREAPPDNLELGFDDEGNLEPIDENLTPEGRLESAHAQDEILGAVNQLPEDLRRVLTLHLGGLSYKEVAEKLGISEPLARKRLERARKRLNN